MFQVMWFHPSMKLLSVDEDIRTDDRRVSVDHPYATEWNLKIDNVRRSDQGNYTCAVVLGDGQSSNKYVFLWIHCEFHFSTLKNYFLFY